MRFARIGMVLLFVSSFGIGCNGTDAPETPPEQPAQAPPPPDTPEGKAQALMDRTRQLIMEQNWAEAEKNLAELQRMRPTLSEDLQLQIENVQSSYLAAKQMAQEGQTETR